MSTRSRIGIIRDKPEGEAPVVESVYCHFDGYPEGVGQTLLDHWTDARKIGQLIALGDLSVLGEEIGRKHDFDAHRGKWVDGTYMENESRGWCLAYRRDRGETDVDSITHRLTEWPDYGQECEYLFDPADSTWRVRSTFGNPVGWNTVADWPGWATIPEAIEAEQKRRAAEAEQEGVEA